MKTQKHKNWKKTKKGWKDLKTGLIWLPKESDIYTHKQAMKLETSEKRLPTIGELRMAWENGARDVMDDWDYWFWSSSVHPDNSSDAFGFDGRNGFVDVGYRNLSGVAVRCVARGVR